MGSHPKDVLMKNEGGVFVDGTEAARAGGPTSNESLAGDGRSKIAAFGDYDKDGWLDIVSASSTLEAPFAYLLHNERDGTFRDVTAEYGVKAQPEGNPCAVM